MELTLLGTTLSGTALTLADASLPADYSLRLDALWTFEQPAESETRFRSEASRHAPGSREAAEAATQIARALGLQRSFPRPTARSTQ